MRHNHERATYSYSIYPHKADESPSVKRRRDEKDLDVKDNPYYIREKIEISKMCDDHMHFSVKYVLIVVIMAYMYGAMIF
mmetsp:Transcript_12038/g.13692  ORF Transcript_12038/g.13692 Transcript_12038/m.13692 type:complete len:80 (-) Transcript_12038:243-482(-)